MMDQDQKRAQVVFRDQNRDIADLVRRANARSVIREMIQARFSAAMAWAVTVYDEGREMSIDFTCGDENRRLDLAGLESDPSESAFVNALDAFLTTWPPSATRR
jgi:hypothetical protein